MSNQFHTLMGSHSRFLFGEYKLRLQSAVAMLVSDYIMDVFRRDDDTWRHRRRTLSGGTCSIQVGMEVKKDITWGVSYIGLKLDEELKMSFCIRTTLSVENLQGKPETVSRIFRCSTWAVPDTLRFRLADENGDLIRNFQFDGEIVQGIFQPLVMEIKKRMLHQRKNSDHIAGQWKQNTC